MKNNVSQADVEATWRRVSDHAMRFWSDPVNVPLYNASVMRPAPEMSQVMREIGNTSAPLMPRIAFKIHRMREAFGNGFVVECIDPPMIVAKG